MTEQRRKRYPSDITDAQWEILEPLIPQPSQEGRPATVERREILNAILYVLRSGCPWRLIPHDLPHWNTAYSYFRQWKRDGTWEQIHAVLRQRLRIQMGREAEPSAGSIDSQSVKTSAVRGDERGFDAGKKISGRKRHILVDSQGLLLAVKVHAANIQDRDGARLLLEPLMGLLPRMLLLWADSAYAGTLVQWIKEHLDWNVEIIKRLGIAANELGVGEPQGEKSKGFQIQPRRWVVERTFAWISRSRRLARDFEGLCDTSEAFIHLAMSRLMLTRLSQLAVSFFVCKHILRVKLKGREINWGYIPDKSV